MLCAAIVLVACGSGEAAHEATTTIAPDTTPESGALTEEEGDEAARAFATTDLQLEVDAVTDGVNVVLSGVVRNAGPSDANNVRVSIERGAGLMSVEPLPANCVLLSEVIDCLVSGSLAVTDSAPNRPEEESAEFELILPIDEALLSIDRKVTVTVEVRADDLDLSDDLHPTSNSSTVCVTIPAG